MKLFRNIGGVVYGVAEEAMKRFQPLATKSYKRAGRLCEDSRQYAAPEAESLCESLDKRGENAGLDIGGMIEDAPTQANAFIDNVAKRGATDAPEIHQFCLTCSSQ